MNPKKVIIYLILPLLISSILATMYFSPSLVAQRLVSPKLPPLPADSWRELGLLENAQNLCLLVMVISAVVGALRSGERIQRAGFAMLALFCVFIFLEEVDYGTHWYKYLTSEAKFEWFKPMPTWDPATIEQMAGERSKVNLHNHGNMTKIFKTFSDTLIALLFVVLPLVAPWIRNRWVRYLAPERYVVLTVFVMVTMSKVIHLVGKLEKKALRDALLSSLRPSWELGSITFNLSEFREFNVYYLFMVYLLMLVFTKILDEDNSYC
jgi:hypothetical protein